MSRGAGAVVSARWFRRGGFGAVVSAWCPAGPPAAHRAAEAVKPEAMGLPGPRGCDGAGGNACLCRREMQSAGWSTITSDQQRPQNSHRVSAIRTSQPKSLCVIVSADDAGALPGSPTGSAAGRPRPSTFGGPMPLGHKQVTPGSQEQNGPATATRGDAPRRSGRRNSCAQPLA